MHVGIRVGAQQGGKTGVEYRAGWEEGNLVVGQDHSKNASKPVGV